MIRLQSRFLCCDISLSILKGILKANIPEVGAGNSFDFAGPIRDKLGVPGPVHVHVHFTFAFMIKMFMMRICDVICMLNVFSKSK